MHWACSFFMLFHVFIFYGKHAVFGLKMTEPWAPLGHHDAEERSTGRPQRPRGMTGGSVARHWPEPERLNLPSKLARQKWRVRHPRTYGITEWELFLGPMQDAIQSNFTKNSQSLIMWNYVDLYVVYFTIPPIILFYTIGTSWLPYIYCISYLKLI